MSREFEIVESKRNIPTVKKDNSTEISTDINNVMEDNFGQILDLVSGIVEIKKMKVQATAILKQMEESRKNLLAEAEAYAIKKGADTDSVTKKMQIVTNMMNDFYKYNNNANLSSNDFSQIITSIIKEMKEL